MPDSTEHSCWRLVKEGTARMKRVEGAHHREVLPGERLVYSTVRYQALKGTEKGGRGSPRRDSP